MRHLYFVVLFLLLEGCTSKQKEGHSTEQQSSIVSLITDITDPRAYLPPAESILGLYHCKQTPDAECIFRLQAITDKRLSPIQTYRLPNTSSVEQEDIGGDPQYRERNVLAFYDVVRRATKEFYAQIDTTRRLDNSECFRVIAQELSYLASVKSKEKTLLIASDLLEKSDLYNVYREDISNPQKIATIFDRTGLLPVSLKGVRVVFLFNPRTREEDKQFYSMAQAYRLVLEQKGAVVNVQANL
jgi:hypothetical protein